MGLEADLSIVVPKRLQFQPSIPGTLILREPAQSAYISMRWAWPGRHLHGIWLAARPFCLAEAAQMVDFSLGLAISID